MIWNVVLTIVLGLIVGLIAGNIPIERKSEIKERKRKSFGFRNYVLATIFVFVCIGFAAGIVYILGADDMPSNGASF